MLSKLILSVDRRHSLEVATKVVELALSNRDLVVGLDICGDPEKGDTREFVELFKRAKLEGLKVTVHLGEVRPERVLVFCVFLNSCRVTEPQLVLCE